MSTENQAQPIDFTQPVPSAYKPRTTSVAGPKQANLAKAQALLEGKLAEQAVAAISEGAGDATDTPSPASGAPAVPSEVEDKAKADEELRALKRKELNERLALVQKKKERLEKKPAEEQAARAKADEDAKRAAEEAKDPALALRRELDELKAWKAHTEQQHAAGERQRAITDAEDRILKEVGEKGKFAKAYFTEEKDLRRMAHAAADLLREEGKSVGANDYGVVAEKIEELAAAHWAQAAEKLPAEVLQELLESVIKKKSGAKAPPGQSGSGVTSAARANGALSNVTASSAPTSASSRRMSLQERMKKAQAELEGQGSSRT